MATRAVEVKHKAQRKCAMGNFTHMAPRIHSSFWKEWIHCLRRELPSIMCSFHGAIIHVLSPFKQENLTGSTPFLWGSCNSTSCSHWILSLELNLNWKDTKDKGRQDLFLCHESTINSVNISSCHLDLCVPAPYPSRAYSWVFLSISAGSHVVPVHSLSSCINHLVSVLAPKN